MPDVELEPDCDVEAHFASEANLLRSAVDELYGALGCDAHPEEVAEAAMWAERVEASAWALKRALKGEHR